MRWAILCATMVVLFVGGRRLLLKSPSPAVQASERHTGATPPALDGALDARRSSTSAANPRGRRDPLIDAQAAAADEPSGAPSPAAPIEVATRAIVRDAEGTALIGASAHLHGLLALESRRTRVLDGISGAPVALGQTDRNGALEFPLAGAAALVVTDTSGRTGATRVVAGQTSTLVLDGPSRALTIVDDATGEAVVARDFPLVWTAGARRVAYSVRTNEKGVVALPVGRGYLELYKSEPRVVLKDLAIDGVATDFAGRPEALRVALEPAMCQLTVRASLEERTLRLVDSSSGRPLSGVAYAQLQRLDPERQRWRGVPATTPIPVRDGALVIGSWFTDPQPAARVESSRRWLSVGGYETLYLESETDLDGRELVVAPGTSRWLRVLDAAGAPIHAPIRVTFGEGLTAAFEADTTGLVGPLTWTSGEDWTVVCSRYAPSENTIRVEAWRLAANEVVELRPTAESARLTITGVPRGAPPLFAIERQGQSWKGTREGTVEVFMGLPHGGYAVGPRAWAQQVQSTGQPFNSSADTVSVAPLDVVLVPGATERLQWNPDWWLETRIASRVVCDEVPSEQLAVLPVYASRERALLFGPETEWLPVERDGAFELQAGGSRPWAFLFARFETDAFGQRVIPLDCQPVRADGRYRVELTSVELIASNADELPEGLSIRVDPVGFGLRAAAPMRFASGLWAKQWDPKTTFRWEGLGAQIEALNLTGSNFNEGVRMELTPGSLTRLVVRVPLQATESAGG